jgi:hydroxymethylpyrimidine/phosphomethylpyrimidine kinase
MCKIIYNDTGGIMKPLFISKKTKEALAQKDAFEKSKAEALEKAKVVAPKMKTVVLYSVNAEKIKTIADIRRLFKSLQIRLQSNVGVEDLTDAINVLVPDREGETK